MQKKLLLITVIFYCICCSSIIAAPKSNALKQITQKIEELKQSLQQTFTKKHSIQQQLKEAETNIGKLSLQINQTKKLLDEQGKILANLNTQQQQYQSQLGTQQIRLSEHIQAAYIMGRQQYLKTLLNQENPEIVSRMLVYYNYIIRNRLQSIADLNSILKNIADNKQKIQQHTTTLQQLQNQLQQQLNQLQIEQKNRQTVLNQINEQINTNSQQLNNLLHNKGALEKVVQRVQKLEVYKPTATHAPFAKLRGKLSWPTHGTIITPFNTPIGDSELRWNGVLLGAQHGQNVYAIAAGKVIFANWMADYGLLLIIDHGDGYMSLYGRNNSLYKKVGDTVKAGDIIATAGNSGGHAESGLYFAIRSNGKPVNPGVWCR